MDAQLTTPLNLSLVGTPNSGKTALFNALTGSRQRSANYPGVTVERKSGAFVTPAGRSVAIVDLPGTYSLRGRSPDEEITRDVVLGVREEAAPDCIVCVADATNLRLSIRLVLELKRVGRPMLLVLNMFDLARHRGITIDTDRLASELGIPVTTAVSVRKGGTAELLQRLDTFTPAAPIGVTSNTWQPLSTSELRALQRDADRIIAGSVTAPAKPDNLTNRIDSVVLQPVAGLLILLAILFVMFQAVFSWAQPLMELLPDGFASLGQLAHAVAAGRPAAELRAERRHLRRRQRHRVPAADHHPVLLHPDAGRFRLHGARRVPDGPHHGRRRAARPRLHPAAVELCLRHSRHHGRARHRQPPRPADHDPDRAADDLLGAHPGLHADHFRLRSATRGVGLDQSSGPRDVRPLRRRHRQRARRYRSSPNS